MNISRLVIALLMSIYGSVSLAKDVVIAFKISAGRKKNIYENIVKFTGLHKPGPDNYHLTVAWIRNVDPQDEKTLRSFLKSELKKLCPS